MFRRVLVSLLKMYMVGCVLWDGLLLKYEITVLVGGVFKLLGQKM